MFISGVTIFQFGHSRTAYDCTAVIYVISKMEECGCIEINFSNSGVGDSQIKLLIDVLGSKQGKLQIWTMNLSGNMLSDKTISDLFHRVSVAFKYLDLSHNMAGAETIKSITTASEAWPWHHIMRPGPPPQLAKKVDTNLSHSMVEAKSMKHIATTFKARPPITMSPGSSSPSKSTQEGNLDLSHNIVRAENVKSMATLEVSPPGPLLSDQAESKFIATVFEAKPTIPISPPPPPSPITNVNHNMPGAESITTALEARPTVPMPPPPRQPPQVAKKMNIDLSHNMAGVESNATASL